MNLDDALQAWAASEVTLPALAADDIYRDIVTSPAGLDARWWANFSGQLAATVVATTRPRRRVSAFG